MPIYEFECGSCGERFEQLCAAGTERLDCTHCGAPGAERRFSSFAYSRQLTPNQRRKIEDKRGVDRGGSMQRWKRNLDRARRNAPKPRKSGGA